MEVFFSQVGYRLQVRLTEFAVHGTLEQSHSRSELRESKSSNPNQCFSENSSMEEKLHLEPVGHVQDCHVRLPFFTRTPLPSMYPSWSCVSVFNVPRVVIAGNKLSVCVELVCRKLVPMTMVGWIDSDMEYGSAAENPL